MTPGYSRIHERHMPLPAPDGAGLKSGKRHMPLPAPDGAGLEAMAVSEELRARREALVVEHMESENRHEYDATIETFDHPRYELIGTGDVYDGPEAVARYFEETRTAFPDQRNELIAMHHADDAVIVEANLHGTHQGPFRGLPPTGRSFEMRFCAVFVFEDERLVCERVYFDSGTILRQLGIARDPLSLSGRVATVLNHPVTVGRALAGRFLAALAIGLVATMALGAAAAKPTTVRSAPGADSASEAKAIKEYWTPRRMRQAEPLDVTPTRREVARAARAGATSAAQRGDAGTVPPTKGAGAIATELKVPMANRVRNPSRYPYRTQGKVFFTWRGGDYVCSATTVNTPTKRVIFTAGHCIIDEGSRSSRFAFVPGYRNGSRPYGTFVATRLFWIQAWGRHGNFSYDVAAAVLGGSRKVGQVVGTRGIKWNLPRQQNFVSYGYPAGLPYNGEQLYNCPSPYRGQDRTTSPPRTQWITCDMTGGSSGGGWIVRGEYLNSVNSYGYVIEPNRMYGPYFGSAVRRRYNQVKNKAP
jgi:steroid delta-isomerase-like uncharacterized protein